MQLPVVDTGSTILVTLGYLCLLLGVIFFAFWLLKRLGFGGMGVQHGKRSPLLLSRLMLGSRQSVAVIRYRDRDMVLGVTEENITLLKEFDADQSEIEAEKPVGFSAMMKRNKDNEG